MQSQHLLVLQRLKCWWNDDTLMCAKSARSSTAIGWAKCFLNTLATDALEYGDWLRDPNPRILTSNQAATGSPSLIKEGVVNEKNQVDGVRRTLLKMVPACAVTCLAGRAVAAQQAPPAASAPTKSSHPFDQELPVRPTNRQLMRAVYQQSGAIPLALFMRRTLGPGKTAELLKTFSEERGTQDGRGSAARLGGSDFERLKKLFAPEAFRGRVVMEVTESTETVHQLKVTECLWASTWRDAGAGDEGYAMICHADFAFARSFNPKVEMVRDQTLMQGHPCCNHRYVIKA